MPDAVMSGSVLCSRGMFYMYRDRWLLWFTYVEYVSYTYGRHGEQMTVK